MFHADVKTMHRIYDGSNPAFAWKNEEINEYLSQSKYLRKDNGNHDIQNNKQYHQPLNQKIGYWFLGAFTKTRKANISFVVSVCPSFRPNGKTLFPLDHFYEI
jgi:hypothetical protein